MYYVYALVDPILKVPFYFGYGSKRRMEQHLKGYDNNNIEKYNYIQRLREIGIEPTTHKIVETEDKYEAQEFERFFIKEGAKIGLPLVNRMGIKRWSRRTNSFIKTTDISAEELKHQYITLNKTGVETAKHFNVTPQILAALTRKYGLFKYRRRAPK